MQSLKTKKIDSLFDFENLIDDMIESLDKDIKESTTDKLREVLIESFKIGVEVGQLPINKKIV